MSWVELPGQVNKDTLRYVRNKPRPRNVIFAVSRRDPLPHLRAGRCEKSASGCVLFTSMMDSHLKSHRVPSNLEFPYRLPISAATIYGKCFSCTQFFSESYCSSTDYLPKQCRVLRDVRGGDDHNHHPERYRRTERFLQDFAPQVSVFLSWNLLCSPEHEESAQIVITNRDLAEIMVSCDRGLDCVMEQIHQRDERRRRSENAEGGRPARFQQEVGNYKSQQEQIHLG